MRLPKAPVSVDLSPAALAALVAGGKLSTKQIVLRAMDHLWAQFQKEPGGAISAEGAAFIDRAIEQIEKRLLDSGGS